MNEILEQINERFIPFWLSLRDERGGFYGGYKGGMVNRDAPKGADMHLKMLWFFSRAFQVLKKPALLDAATWAYEYIIKHMVDPTYGGLHYSVTCEGVPLDTLKRTEVTALALYAFSAHFDATRDHNVLKQAYECFNTLEFRCRRRNGYREQFDWCFTPMMNTKAEENAERTTKTMLRILEAYVDFYMLTKDENVRNSLLYVYEVFKRYLYNEKLGSLEVYLDQHFRGISEVVDFGLNMQASWTLSNAAQVLGELTRDDVAMIKRLAETALKDGFDNEAMMYRKIGKKPDYDRIGWVQAESIIALLNLYAISKSEAHLDAAKTLWSYIKDELIFTGGWYWGKTKEGRLLDVPLCSEARGPYHDGRMFLEILRRGIIMGL
ncbi:MAG: AGE family epimerase/isomerase [Firmicutes bacterium]|nr:AGE family epimerase/isomerase [Bacillota bacterium]